MSFSPISLNFIPLDKLGWLQKALDIVQTNEKFDKSGYSTMNTIQVILEIFLKTLGFMCILGVIWFGLGLVWLVLKDWDLPWVKLFELMMKEIAKMALLALPLRVLIESFLKFLVNLSIETNYLLNSYEERRTLSFTSSTLSGYIISLFLFFSGSLILVIIVWRSIWKQTRSRLVSKIMTTGLNKTRSAYLGFYFSHFFVTRILISLFIFLSPIVP